MKNRNFTTVLRPSRFEGESTLDRKTCLKFYDEFEAFTKEQKTYSASFDFLGWGLGGKFHVKTFYRNITEGEDRTSNTISIYCYIKDVKYGNKVLMKLEVNVFNLNIDTRYQQTPDKPIPGTTREWVKTLYELQNVLIGTEEFKRFKWFCISRFFAEYDFKTYLRICTALSALTRDENYLGIFALDRKGFLDLLDVWLFQKRDNENVKNNWSSVFCYENLEGPNNIFFWESAVNFRNRITELYSWENQY